MHWHMRVLRPVTGVALSVLLLTAACADDATGPDDDGRATGTPGLHVVAGAGVTDTIGASLTQALVVEVFDDDGRAASGVVVRFESVEEEGAWVGVSRLDAAWPAGLAVDTPDARGRAAVLVYLGERTGTARVAIVVPELGLADTATYTITPGAPASMTAAPSDTAIYVGASRTLSARVVDRADNVLESSPELTRIAGPVEVDGMDVTGTGVGRASVEVRAAGFVDTAQRRARG